MYWYLKELPFKAFSEYSRANIYGYSRNRFCIVYIVHPLHTQETREIRNLVWSGYWIIFFFSKISSGNAEFHSSTSLGTQKLRKDIIFKSIYSQRKFLHFYIMKGAHGLYNNVLCTLYTYKVYPISNKQEGRFFGMYSYLVSKKAIIFYHKSSLHIKYISNIHITHTIIKLYRKQSDRSINYYMSS